MSSITRTNTQRNQKDINTDFGTFTNKQFAKTSFDNNKKYNYVPIIAGMSRIQFEFGDNPEEDDYLEHAYNCMRKIGNVNIDLYGFTGRTDKNGEICLPVSAVEIEYVTDGEEDWVSWSIHNQLSQHYAPGHFITYKWLGDKLVTNLQEEVVSVAYWAEKVDENGFMMITEAEVEACAHYWKWIDTKRKWYRGNQIAQNIYPQVTFDKNRAINQARRSEGWSQNYLDQLLEVVYSRDRKVYNRSFKALKLG